ncbi:uncharacterized protein Z519_08190 [Cladophialophora bantiana CBS 173.52]|uniref:Impact N-terminal domain-containing protein n=1 Tax=Cladophialophora bantiana (strain ATCC 10958 / CBS 173.52 / CDC B-1940 / NIH 8579) TaxID=1442370 RepID=A0A0D2I308_CLAB1|nr:uncharacterized protein Z519_08190 [Cladophialophora bantiana CBS 173.52]KIW91294.1 hypothetical protein Z519_08190 [Cladophialophora bantiana CBS 173.52]
MLAPSEQTKKKRPLSPRADKEDTTTAIPEREELAASSAAATESNDGPIFVSAPVHDRQSTFVAHFHPSPSVFAKRQSATGPGSKPLSLTAIVKRLQSHASFASANHRIVAWRRRSSQQTLFTATPSSPSLSSTHSSSALLASAGAGAGGQGKAVIYATGSEDDGEKYAGKRLERLLADLDVEGVVVVARWYGGVLLGPVRFTHIEDVAHEAIRAWKVSITDSLFSDGGLSKRQRLLGSDSGGGAGDVATRRNNDEDAIRSRLAEQLAERDQSIVVLRGLLADKTKAASTTVDEPQPQSQPAQQQSLTTSTSPAKKIDYSEMPLARLKQLERARDATIAFILRQLDKVEEEEKAKEKDSQKQGRDVPSADIETVTRRQGEQGVEGVDEDRSA